MNSFLAVLSPFFVGLIALVMFLNWITALVFVGFLALICFFAVRFHEKHNRPYQLDEKLPGSRQQKAMLEYVEIMQGVKRKRGD